MTRRNGTEEDEAGVVGSREGAIRRTPRRRPAPSGRRASGSASGSKPEGAGRRRTADARDEIVTGGPGRREEPSWPAPARGGGGDRDDYSSIAGGRGGDGTNGPSGATKTGGTTVEGTRQASVVRDRDIFSGILDVSCAFRSWRFRVRTHGSRLPGGDGEG